MSENVKSYGATGNGSTDDRTAFQNADAAAVTKGAAVFVPVGTYALANNLSLASPIEFESGAQLAPASGKTLTLNGSVSAPVSQIFGGAGAVVLAKAKSPTLWADWFSGTDIGAKINAAFVAVSPGPATIKVSANSHLFSTTINLQSARCIRLTSETGDLNSVTDWGPALIWTGGAGSGSALKVWGSIGFEVDHLNLSYNNSAYDGNLLSLIHVAGGMDTGTPHVHHCRFAGTSTAHSAARLIELSLTEALTIEHSSFDYAMVGIGCSGGSNNQVNIGPSCWFDQNFSDCAIKMWGNAWTIGPIVAESGASVTSLVKLAGDTTALTINGAMALDGGAGGGTLIDLTGYKCQGVTVNGGSYGAQSGTFIRCSDVIGDTQGLSVHGAIVSGMTTGVHLGSSNGASLKGNRFSCTTPWTGTAPTDYQVGANDLGATTTSGVPIAQDSSVALTPPGSAVRALGIVMISVREDNINAIYSLRAGGGLTDEISDASGSFSPTFNNSGTMNVYYDAVTTCMRLQNKRGSGVRTVQVTSLVGL